MADPAPRAPRMSGPERRAAIVQVAAELFGRRGYAGTTTDDVARASGISQPYVVRMFGTKEALFLEVVESAEAALLAAFRQVVAETPEPRDPDALDRALGEEYVRLARDRGVHLALLQAFTQGADPAVGARARAGFLAIWRMLREEAGFTAAAARDFLASGMLISVLLGLDMGAESADPSARELLVEACGPELAALLG